MTDEKPIPCPKCGEPFPNGRALGGHAKTHNRPPPAIDWDRMEPTPACFDSSEDWRYSVEKSRIEHPTIKRFTRDYALSEACRGCTREYQEEMIAVDQCQPPPNALTPLRILEEGIVLDDE